MLYDVRWSVDNMDFHEVVEMASEQKMRLEEFFVDSTLYWSIFPFEPIAPISFEEFCKYNRIEVSE